MKNDKYLNIVGLAFRARKCTLGEEAIVKAIQNKRTNLVILAEDIGPSSKKKITDKCKSNNIPYVFAHNRDILSHAIGQSGRVAIAINDPGFAKKILSYFT